MNLTKEEKKMLKVVAAYNDTTEELATIGIVKSFLRDFMNDNTQPICNMLLPEIPKETVKEQDEAPKPRKKPGRKPKAEKMTREDFVNYFSGDRDIEKVRDAARLAMSEEAD